MVFKWGQKGDESAKDAFLVRLTVFVQEQGFSPEVEIDVIDDAAFHLTAYTESGEPFCAARLFREHDNVWHAGRIAVSRLARGKGAGKALMLEIKNKAVQLGAEKILLGAQHDKAMFYEKCGYCKTGKEFLDEGYPHVEMVLTL